MKTKKATKPGEEAKYPTGSFVVAITPSPSDYDAHRKTSQLGFIFSSAHVSWDKTVAHTVVGGFIRTYEAPKGCLWSLCQGTLHLEHFVSMLKVQITTNMVKVGMPAIRKAMAQRIKKYRKDVKESILNDVLYSITK